MIRKYDRPAQHGAFGAQVMLRVVAIAALIVPCVAQAQAQGKSTKASAASVLPLESNGAPIEIATLGDIYLTKSGAVLFADTKPVTVRIREGRNGNIRQIARTGAGPGEFRQMPSFVGFNGDSIAAFDSGLRRWSIFTSTGAFARVLATGAESQAYANAAAWVVDGALVFNATLDKSRAPLAAVLSMITGDSPSDAAPIVIRQVSNGDLWSAPTVSSKSWTVYDRAGRRRTTYTFASSFRFDAANDTVAIGRTVDDDELPQITRLPLRAIAGVARPKATPGSASGTVDATDAERVAAHIKLIALLRTIVGKQEGVYSDSGRYVMTTRALKLEVPGDFRVDILDANNRGWFAMARDTKSRMTCAMGVGMNLIIGWSEANPYCSP